MTDALPFIKMHGIGNDYVYVDGFAQTVDDPPALARAMADRHFGVGGDGLILVLPPPDAATADVRMRMYNADGSEAEMCGNGIRCVCKFAYDRGLSRARPMRVHTGAGVLTLDYMLGADGRVDRVTVDMGAPRFELSTVGVHASHLVGERGVAHAITVGGETFDVHFVSMGNPHAVVFVDDVEGIDLRTIGPMFEDHPAFANRINTHFVRLESRGEMTMRTWERGSGATLACGTGAAAVCVAGARDGRSDRAVDIHLPGGDLQLRWEESTDHVLMTGAAAEVFSGVWPGHS